MTDSQQAQFEIQDRPGLDRLDASLDSPSQRREPPNRLDQACLDQLSDLELELTRTRHAAEAARLNAKAAELELRIRRLKAGGGPRSKRGPELKLSKLNRKPEKQWHFRSLRPSTNFADEVPASAPDRTSVGAAPPAAKSIDIKETPHSDRRAPVEQNSHLRVDKGGDSKPQQKSSAGKKESPDPVSRKKQSENSREPKSKPIDKKQAQNHLKDSVEILNESVEISAQSNPEQNQKRKPAAWMMSAVFHGVLLIALATFSLSTHQSGDQIAIAGSVAETEELAVENLQIETQQLEVSETDPVPTETELIQSEFGEIQFQELQVDSPLAPPAPPIQPVNSSQANLATALSMKSDSDAKMEFCGVKGGGNHFIYLVDSSSSMGDAFVSAREELLRSIQLLNSDQRFYVIFFDSQPDYMRLTSPATDEPRSVYATAENKQALQRWAMTIKMDRGKAPYDALPFALDLNPDVVFLLSDGEFPQKIEDLLNSTNRVENLFGDSGPISIVHTIGYHSRQGAERMQRIASQNGGQYRYVPEPK